MVSEFGVVMLAWSLAHRPALWLALLFALIVIGGAWLGWRAAKTEQHKLYLWMGVVMLILTALAVLHREGVL
jgi:hypothetical protein